MLSQCKTCLIFVNFFVLLKFNFYFYLNFVSLFRKYVSLQTPGNVTKRKNLTLALAINPRTIALNFGLLGWVKGLANPLVLRLYAKISKKVDKAIRLRV